MTTNSRTLSAAGARMLRVILVCGALFGVMRGTAAAQTPNGGAINVSAGMDVPSAYVYRGILQEGDPKLTLTPFGQVSIRLSGDPGPASTDGTRINVGVWNGLLTGTSGSGGPLKRIHYAEQFSASVSFGVGHGIVVSPGYLANTSPNRGYNTVKEFTLNVGATGAIAPYGFLAVELDDAGQMDGGSKKGTYLELGAVPSFGLSLWHSRLSVPVRAGFSLSNYYELFESTLTFNDHPFGFVEVGGHLTVPVSSSASRFGTWNVHGGVDFFSFGDTTRAFNLDEKTRVVVSGGVALLY